MTTLDAGTIEALGALLEDERASVEGEVALAGGATEHLEREAFVSMGREDVEACAALRERLARAGVPISPRVGAAADAMLDAASYDGRLRAFAAHQHRVGRRAWELLEALPEREEALHRTLLGIYEAHVRHATWAERRAEEFAATREWAPKGMAGTLAVATERAVRPHTVPAERALVVMRPEHADATGQAPGPDGGGGSALPRPAADDADAPAGEGPGAAE